MTIQELLQKYPLKVNSTVLIPLAQHFYFSKPYDVPPPSLAGMYFLANELSIPKSSVRVTLSRMCKDGSVLSFKDASGTTRYKMGNMMTLISEQAVLFGKGDGFTIAVFNFKREDEKERYRVREILRSFGFKKLAQNVYISLKVDSKRLGYEFAAWGLRDNVFLFDCADASDDSMKSKIASLWCLDEWGERLTVFYDILKEALDFENTETEEIYKRYSISYSIFFAHFHEKHPSIPFNYFPEGYPLGKIYKLLEETVQNYGEQIVSFYCYLNQ